MVGIGVVCGGVAYADVARYVVGCCVGIKSYDCVSVSSAYVGNASPGY